MQRPKLNFVSFLAGLVVGSVLFAGILTVSGQGALLTGKAAPVIVNIQRDIPATTTVSIPGSNGKTITATVPMTVGVNLQVTLNGSALHEIKVTTPTVPALVTVPEVNVSQTDALGIPYTVIIADKDAQEVKLTNWTAFADPQDNLRFNAELRLSEDARAFNSIDITTKLYDRKDSLISVDNKSVTPSYLEPGKSTNLDIYSSTDTDNVKRYEVSIAIQR